ncbi:helix-turn-helix domain-containing protein [Nocardia sp. R16R-3T]
MDRGSLNRAFGWELRVRREAAGLTKDTLRSQLGWGLSTYKRTEAGTRDVELGDIYDVAAALNVSPTTLFERVDRRVKTGDYPHPTPGEEWRNALGL